MLRIGFSLFVTGLLMGAGPCLLSCGPVLISYIAGTKRSALQGLQSWFIFSLSRFSVTVFLGFIAGTVGAGLFSRFYYGMPGSIIWFVMGVFISFLGILIFFGIHTKVKVCGLLNRSLIQHDTKSLIALGLLIGILPCVPLIGIFSYITMASTYYTHGILMGAAFGLGTVISPLALMAMAAGAIPKLKLLQHHRALIIFQKICGLILFFLGAHVVANVLIKFAGTA
jgi:hypothetical protein